MCHSVRSFAAASLGAIVVGLLAVPSPAVADGVGLVAAERLAALPGPQGWSALLGNMPAHTTLGLRAAAPGRTRSARLLGNYFVDGALPGDTPNGFRATGGIVLPSPASTDPLSALLDDAVHRTAPYSLQRSPGSSYVGLGYTRAWQSGLRFNADLGHTRPFGSSAVSGVGASGDWLDDDTLRSLRPSTSLELGMNYSF